ncbi:hypothetical protein DY000_02045152 [Brassica cretica]|uniref:Disease resistance protein At4g27190-like leucine-rich repeats domain-containing protein n=1 Tax=Brassica cretica TaxID=69181 RepID=A0ABQ7ETM9_BRACR|nr:hypothetical protein DY000_02045152 [Brassica cretica]
MLIHLNLELTKVVSCDGISNLSRLRTLKLARSQVWLDMSLMKELQLLEHLEFVSVNIFSSLVGKLLYDPRVGRCIQQIYTEDRPEEESVQVFVLPAMDALRRISMWNCGMREIEVVEKTQLNKSPTSPLCFSNLSVVHITGCNGLKDLTWLLFVPNLTHLELQCLEKVEEIISEERVSRSVTDEPKARGMNTPFQKLERLDLINLPRLKRIYWSSLIFPCLKKIEVEKCPKMRKLPLSFESCVGGGEELVINYRDDQWFKRVRWEDKATKDRFLPCCEKLLTTYSEGNSS